MEGIAPALGVAVAYAMIEHLAPERESVAVVKETVKARHPEDRPLDEDLGAWWVMHVKPNCEKQVATYLLNRNISYYLPLYQRKTKVGYWHRIRTTEVPLFSGYLCFALDRERHNLLYDTKKLVRIIKVDDQERFVKELHAISRAIETGEDLLVKPGLVPGRRVLILSGPLEGAEGVVVRRRTERQLALSVQMFNQSVLVKLDPWTKIEPL
ncbi:MAG: transcription termination/antitermination protein NusG [Desulfomonilaceae bacterium]